MSNRHSTFTAINRVEDEEDIEEHTRELQIELGFKIFEEALSLQKSKNFVEAAQKYEELFQIEVVTSRNITDNPTIENLKYLSLRNRGLLKLAELLEQCKNSSDKQSNDRDDEQNLEIFERLLSVMNDLASSLCHGESDLKSIEVLSQIFSHFGLNRLARLTYEYELSNNEQHDLQNRSVSNSVNGGGWNTDDDGIRFDLKNFSSLLPTQINFLENYKALLQKLDEDTSPEYQKLSQLLAKRGSLGPKKHLSLDNLISVDEFQKLRRQENDIIEIEIDQIDGMLEIGDFLKSLNDILPKPKGRSKVYDNYILTDAPVEKIKFILIEKEVVEVPPIPIQTQVEKAPILEEVDIVEISDDEAAPKSNPDPQSVPNSATATPTQPAEATPAQRIATKRITRAKVETLASELTPESFLHQNNFLTLTLAHYLSLCGLKVEQSTVLVGALLSQPCTTAKDTMFFDFADALNNWSKDESEALMVKLDEEGENGKSKESSIKEILNFSVKTNYEKKNTLENLDNGELIKLVENVSERRLHLNQLRICILQHLFDVERFNGGNLITDGLVKPETMKQLRLIIDAVGIHLFKSYTGTLAAAEDEIIEYNENTRLSLSCAVSIMEILTDSLISLKMDQKLRKFPNKAMLNEIQVTEEITANRIERWLGLLEDYFAVFDPSTNSNLLVLWLRHNWCRIWFYQYHSSFDTEVLSSLLSEMALKSKEASFDVLMINYENIPRLNKSNIDIQLSKMSIFETFTSNDSSNQTLEHILCDDGDTKANYTEEEKEMDVFINKSPIELRLRLWAMLFRFYGENDLIDKFLLGFQRVIKVMLEEITDAHYAGQTKFHRTQTLLKIVGFFGLFSEQLVSMGMKKGWQLDLTNVSLQTLSDLIGFFNILYLFLLNEDAAKISSSRKTLKSKSPIAHKRLTDTVVLSFTLLALFYSAKLTDSKPEDLNDFYGSLHEQLGVRNMCNHSNGIYLDFVETKLVDLNWEHSDNDFFQTLACRYGIKITTDTFSTFDHEVESCELKRENAIKISKYLLSYFYKKKHPMFNTPKSDIKALLDNLFSVIGVPTMKNPTIMRNTVALAEYLDNKSLDVRLLKFAFYGLLSVETEKPDLDIMDAASRGLYFLEGVFALSLFKIRKRTMQGRSAELDFVIQMFECDLLCGNNRFETWLLLAQTYSYLVEDDIIWTSDKLNNIEKKSNTALLQRKSLLCYLMAINVYTKLSYDEKENLGSIPSILWTSLGKELYNSVMSPMSRLAFTATSASENLVLTADGFEAVEKESAITSPISNKTIYKVLIICFKQACKMNPKDWNNYFYLAKVQSKLKDCKLIDSTLKNILKSGELALKSSNKEDPIVEPHYFLCSLVYKLVRHEVLAIEKAVEYLKQDTLFQTSLFEVEVHTMEEFGKLIIALLLRCVSYDKKNWQHRPKYRLAKIYLDQFKDVEAAKKEMSSIVNLKSTVRNLSNIWKPENERPGKHFVYNHDYIKFYVELLDQSNDVHSLIQLIRKLRKLGSSMINQIKLFDLAVAKTCFKIKKIIKVEKGFLDTVLSRMIYSEFISNCNRFVEYMKQKKDFTEHEQLILYFLNEVSDFRRMANGFAATGVIDDCYHSLFLVLLTEFLDKEEPTQDDQKVQVIPDEPADKQLAILASNGKNSKTPGTPTKEKVKVARRDITPFCIQLLAAVVKLLEQLRREAGEGKFLEFTLSNEDEDSPDQSSVPPLKHLKDKNLSNGEDLDDRDLENMSSKFAVPDQIFSIRSRSTSPVPSGESVISIDHIKQEELLSLQSGASDATFENGDKKSEKEDEPMEVDESNDDKPIPEIKKEISQDLNTSMKYPESEVIDLDEVSDGSVIVIDSNDDKVEAVNEPEEKAKEESPALKILEATPETSPEVPPATIPDDSRELQGSSVDDGSEDREQNLLVEPSSNQSEESSLIILNVKEEPNDDLSLRRKSLDDETEKPPAKRPKLEATPKDTDEVADEGSLIEGNEEFVDANESLTEDALRDANESLTEDGPKEFTPVPDDVSTEQSTREEQKHSTSADQVIELDVPSEAPQEVKPEPPVRRRPSRRASLGKESLMELDGKGKVKKQVNHRAMRSMMTEVVEISDEEDDLENSSHPSV